MMARQLIANIEDMLARCGVEDAEVVVGEANGVYREHLGLNADRANMIGHAETEDWVLIVQGYVRLT